MPANITQEYLKTILKYEPDTGRFYWLQPKQGRRLNRPVGSVDKDGYYIIGIDYNDYLAHRLAWLYMTGAFPELGLDVDHKDNVPGNTKWDNLRLLTRSANSHNNVKSVRNTSGVTGVHFEVYSGRWKANLMLNRQRINIGRFATKDEAVEARLEAELKHKVFKYKSHSSAYKYLKEKYDGRDL